MDELGGKIIDTLAFIKSPVLLLREEARDGWHCVYINEAAKALVGEREDELIADIAPLASDLEGCSTWRGEKWGRKLAAQLNPYPEGYVLIFLWDVTEETLIQQRKADAANAALRSALDAANAASKAKSDFLSNMSHDIRTPLNAIIGMTTIARAHLGEVERVEDCLEKIGLSSQHLLALINDILDMSRIESGRMTLSPEEFTMADFIHSLMAVFRPQADKKNLLVELDFSGIRHEKVRGDQLRIQQVLINILSNAVKFTPAGGKVTMSVRETGEAVKGGHGYAYYEFVIRDTGIGMSKEFLERIFQPFERAENVSRIEGTGLGMTITSNLVKMMNGEIAVTSEEGRGTCFTVTLPLEQLISEEEGFRELSGLRVLAADSDAASLKNLREILSDLGMECDSCENAWLAGDLATQSLIDGKKYFAVMLGWRLPVVDGVQAAREMRALLGEEIPIFVMSSYEWTLTGDEMRKYGITAFMPKPIFRSRLGEALYAFTPAGRKAHKNGSSDEEERFEGRRVLLVEDNEINREIGVELIEMLGAEVECAEDGKQAVEIFRSAGEGHFDIIFMDIQMPVMNGFEATRAIRALPDSAGSSVPIVAMSANAFVEDIRACERAGMDAHVPKPVNLNSLRDVMRRFLNGDGRQGGGSL